MALLDASNAFSKIFNMGDPDLVYYYAPIAGGTTTTASWKTIYDPPISAGFPGERAILTATGQNFTYDVDGKPTGGELTSISFALGETNIDTSVFFTADAPVGITALVIETGTLEERAQSFWRALLSGDDIIRAPAQRNVAMTGDFFQVMGAVNAHLSLTGGNDRLVSAFDNDPALPQPGQATLPAFDGAYSGLVGDSFLVGGVMAKSFVFTGALTGGADTLILKGFAGLDATGDAYRVADYGIVTGGDDVITCLSQGTPVPSDTITIRLTGDVKEDLSGAKVTGGADHITGSDYAFYIDRISGDVDSLTGGWLKGGDDDLSGRGGQDRIAGDVFDMDGGTATAGNDVIRGGEDSDLIAGDVFSADDSGAIGFNLTCGDDTISGDAGNDVIAGDVLSTTALSTGDVLRGGNDHISGGSGNDTLNGDFVFFGLTGATFIAGNDRLDGGLGDDVINGNGGTDTAVFDSLKLAVVVDLLAGTATGQGKDTLVSIENLVGSDLGDTLRGDSGGNRLKGGAGNDTLAGRAGDDALLGGGGADKLIGGKGGDTLTGGGGADLFVFGPAFGGPDTVDRIRDFADGTDKLDLTAYGFSGFAAVKALASDVGDHLSLDLPGAELVMITGLHLATFNAGDVLL